MSEVLVPAAKRDPKRPPAPVPPREPSPKEVSWRDYWRFFNNARRNLITAFSDVAYREPVIRRRFRGVNTWIVSDPELIKHIMLDNAENYPKSDQQKRRVGLALGDGLLLAEGESWRWQRRTTAPGFQMRKIVAFAPMMVQAAQDMLAEWDKDKTGERDIAADMMRLTYDVLSRTVFGQQSPIDAERLAHAFEIYFDTAGRLDIASFLNLPKWVPTLGRLRVRPALRILRSEIGAAIAKRRAEIDKGIGLDRTDLLTMLMTAKDPESGRPMDDALVYDNAVTFIIAGHETTANALSWTFFLLSEYRWAEERVLAEIDSVLEGRAPTADDVPKLVYCRQVFEEAMRLYPPIPVYGREAKEADKLGRRRMTPGTQIVVAPWIVHRHEKVWDEPDLFDPERFAPGKREQIHRFAYIPFAGGPRICIGMAFAMQESLLLLSSILQRYRLKLKPGHVVEPHASVTLRPKDGLPMILERRD